MGSNVSKIRSGRHFLDSVTMVQPATTKSAFQKRLHARGWNWIAQRVQTDPHMVQWDGFLHSLLEHSAPLDVVRSVVPNTRHAFRPPHNRGRNTPVVIAGIHCSDDVFRYVVNETKEMEDSCENTSGPDCILKNFDTTIPFDRLQVLLETFPIRSLRAGTLARLRDYLLFNTANTQDNVDKYMYTLQMMAQDDLPERDLYYNGNTFLAPHALLCMFLKEVFDDDSRRFILSGLPSLQFLFLHVPGQFLLKNNRRDTLLHLLLSRVDLRVAESWTSEQVAEHLPKTCNLRDMFYYVIHVCSATVRETNGDGRLPLHIALLHRVPVHDKILHMYPTALHTKCPVTNLFPFQLAALNLNLSVRKATWRDASTVGHTYEILRKAPLAVLA